MAAISSEARLIARYFGAVPRAVGRAGKSTNSGAMAAAAEAAPAAASLGRAAHAAVESAGGAALAPRPVSMATYAAPLAPVPRAGHNPFLSFATSAM
ncbi:hypothetical protein C2E21_7437 [Chlorella sorokiniana]|jgi:hypothetical protein|uniref:Uncharacterized protein n=1 Tax=Chlorella sorokiniana TaxID=3076 RepID=A0A2P6THM2_CHLSO|nr:hypothetical protein C2E21_7437 [Chlorella sorokiniana]|eukprot:PRW33777.1 hypothetical protein C2E21_7437 [Chlorella sorokiniana]